MARYMIEDTADGFRLSLVSPAGPHGLTRRFSFEETGSHGVLAALFALNERLWPFLAEDARKGPTAVARLHTDLTTAVGGPSSDHPLRTLGTYLTNAAASHEPSGD